MEFKDHFLKLRERRGLSQQEVAEQLNVTRQAVSRWERGETTPNVDTLKQISRLMDVSLNTLLGCPRELYCQSCGMPLEDEFLGRDSDGALNENSANGAMMKGTSSATAPWRRCRSSVYPSWCSRAWRRAPPGSTWRRSCPSWSGGNSRKGPPAMSGGPFVQDQGFSGTG